MKTTKAIQKACQVLRHRVRYKSASLRLPGSNNDDTLQIRAAVRLYVETWIVPILDAIEDGDMAKLREITERETSEFRDPR